jgi:hypothetical protein
VFDTTASNTGRLNVAATLLEQRLQKSILFLACRHHVLEIILQAAVSEARLHVSSGPDIAIFKRFKNSWREMNSENLSLWNTNAHFAKIIEPIRQDVLCFCMEALNEQQPRKDYKEFIELVIITLGGIPPGGIKIHQPGAYHQARWMAKGIYCLKIFLLRSQFNITKAEENSLSRICAFIVKCYIRMWCNASKACSAPLNDFNFIKTLQEYKNDDEKVA